MRYAPYSHPGDSDRAGLRDYLPRPTAPRSRAWTPVWIAIAFVAGLLAGATLATAAEPPVVSMLVRPQMMLQRSDVRVEVRVARHSDNRALSIAWTSDLGTAGSSLRQLDGEDDQVLHVLSLPSQPPANYLFVASVFGIRGRLRGRTTARIAVPDDGPPLDARRRSSTGALSQWFPSSPAAARRDLPETRTRP